MGGVNALHKLLDPNASKGQAGQQHFRMCDTLPSLRIGNKNYTLYLVFGRFPAELGPETRFNGSGSKNDAGRTPN